MLNKYLNITITNVKITIIKRDQEKNFPRIIFVLFILLSSSFSLNAESDVKRIYEGNPDAKITILAFESLTCSHCANFHKDIYPELKKNSLLIEVLLNWNIEISQ